MTRYIVDFEALKDKTDAPKEDAGVSIFICYIKTDRGDENCFQVYTYYYLV